MQGVQHPNLANWGKLKRVLQFSVWGTKYDNKKIETRNLHSLHTYIDASYAIHDNKRNHNVGLITTGIGIVHGKSSRENLNVKSSTEAEIVGMSDYLPNTLWTYNFIRAQEYEIRDNVLYQDNMSAIKMGENGRLSCTGNS